MKSVKRRLLSLLLAMVMVLSLAPSALATDPPASGGDTENPPSSGETGHTHTLEETITTPPTCTTEGVKTITCTTDGCTEYPKKEPIPATGHEWDEANATTTKPATCTEPGEKTVRCKKCSETNTVAIPSLGHDFDATKPGAIVSRVEPTCITKGELVVKCSRCDAQDTREIPATPNEHTKPTGTGSAVYTPIAGGVQHSYVCEVCKKTIAENHVFGTGANANTCTLCGYERVGNLAITLSAKTLSWAYNETAAKTLTATVAPANAVAEAALTATVSPAGVVRVSQSADKKTFTVEPIGNGTATITVSTTVDSKTVRETCTVTVANPLTINQSTTILNYTGAYSTLTPNYNGAALPSGAKIEWSLNNPTTDASYVRLTANSNGTATVTAIAGTTTARTIVVNAYCEYNGVNYRASASLTLSYSAANAATVTVYTSSGSYNLNDPDDVGGTSIITQLNNYFTNYTANRYYGLAGVRFTSVTDTYGRLNANTTSTYYVDGRTYYGDSNLANVYFTPGTRTGTATFSLIAYVYRGSSQIGSNVDEIPCTISFRVTEGTVAGGDVTYTASMGDNVYFRSGDFEDFWDDNFPRGTLTSVRFSVSGGTLRDSNGKTVGTAECYVSARSNQIDLDDVYFEPNSTNSKKAGTIRFNFTATGYARNSNQAVTRTGTVSIIYLSASPKDITYTVGANGSVNLKASDFTAAYKEATGSTAPTGLTIVLQNVPSRGSLSYTDSSKSSASAVRLTSSNIKSRNFTTRSSGTNQINDVSYTGTSGTDTVEYIAYSGSTAQFSGKIVFNGAAPAPTDITVTFTSTSGAAAQFTQAAFTTANATVMAKTTRIRFTTPSNGNLLLSGTSSAAGVDIAPTSLGSVTYRPKAGYNGNDRCMFMCYDSTGTLVGSGTVTLVVVGNPTTTTPTTPSNGATSVSQFKDVPANAWYRTELADLVSKGIINGTSATTFAPNSAVNYGAALKMILRAAGYSAQEETGNNWAIHYKELAVSKGWISNDIALNDPIPRSAMADLVAKVLGIASSSAASPFADTANGYAVALYETKIFTGTPGENGGKPNFLGSNNLTRAQICAVIYRVNQYYETISSSQKPDGL